VNLHERAESCSCRKTGTAMGFLVNVGGLSLADHLAKVLSTEVGDHNCSASIVLDDLVIRVLRSSAVDRRRSGVLLDSDGILADVLYVYYIREASRIHWVSPPNQTEMDEFVCVSDMRRLLTILESARAETVDAFSLVGADDDVRESSSLLEQEDGFVVATFVLTAALYGCQRCEIGSLRDTHSTRSTIIANVATLSKNISRVNIITAKENLASNDSPASMVMGLDKLEVLGGSGKVHEA
jgi:hypothetical protein